MSVFPESPGYSGEPFETTGSGLLIVTPLSEAACEQAGIITQELNLRLGTTLWTPHRDITHGRLIALDSGLSRARYDEIVEASADTLGRAAPELASPFITLDAIDGSPDAVIAMASRGVKPVADLRNWFVDKLTPILGFAPKVKDPEFVHTTLGRFNSDVEHEIRRDAGIVAREVSAQFAEHPIAQTIGSLVLARESERYVLEQLVEIRLGT